MSLGFKTERSSITLPSTNINGLLSPLVEIPRILILEPLPGEPEADVILTPAIWHWSACSTLVGLSFSIA